MCRGVSHTPFTAAKKHIKRMCHVRRYHFISAHMRAYAIRPYTCSVKNDGVLGGVLVSSSPTSGRMRYAPTLVRLKSWVCWGMGWFRFRSFQGVCDTPLQFSCGKRFVWRTTKTATLVGDGDGG